MSKSTKRPSVSKNRYSNPDSPYHIKALDIGIVIQMKRSSYFGFRRAFERGRGVWRGVWARRWTRNGSRGRSGRGKGSRKGGEGDVGGMKNMVSSPQPPSKSGQEYARKRRESLERGFGVLGISALRGEELSKHVSLPESKPTKSEGGEGREESHIKGHLNGLRAHPVQPIREGFVPPSPTGSRPETRDGSELEAILERGFGAILEGGAVKVDWRIAYVEGGTIPPSPSRKTPEPQDGSKNDGMTISVRGNGSCSGELKELVHEPSRHQEIASLPIGDSDDGILTAGEPHLPERKSSRPRHRHSSTYSSSESEMNTMKRVNWDESTFEEQRYRPSERKSAKSQHHGGHPGVEELMGWSYSALRPAPAPPRTSATMNWTETSTIDKDSKHKHEIRFSGPSTRNGKLVKRANRESREVLESVSGNGNSREREKLSVMDAQFWRDPRRANLKSLERARSFEEPLPYPGSKRSSGRERSQSPSKHLNNPDSAGGHFGECLPNTENRTEPLSQFPVQAPAATNHTKYNSLPGPLRGSFFEKYQNGSGERPPIPSSAEERPRTSIPRTVLGIRPQSSSSALARPSPLTSMGAASNLKQAKQEYISESLKINSIPAEYEDISSLPPLNHFAALPKPQVPNFSLPVPSRNSGQNVKTTDLRTKVAPRIPSPSNQDLRSRSPTRSSTPQRTPSFRESHSSVDSVYHTPASSFNNSKVDLTVGGGTGEQKTKGKEGSIYNGQNEGRNGSVKRPMPEAPTRVPPAPPARDPNKSVSLYLESEPALTFVSHNKNAVRRSEETATRTKSMDISGTSVNPAIPANPTMASTKPPFRSFPLVNEPKMPKVPIPRPGPDSLYFSQLSRPSSATRSKSSSISSTPASLSGRPSTSHTTSSSHISFPVPLPSTPQPEPQHTSLPSTPQPALSRPPPPPPPSSSRSSSSPPRPSTAPSSSPSKPKIPRKSPSRGLLRRDMSQDSLADDARKAEEERKAAVGKEVRRFEESFPCKVTLTEAFREGVKKGHGLGFVEGYQAGVRAARLGGGLI